MNFVILDLEWNAAYSKKLRTYINEIIEFGAVKCDENLNIVSTFSSFVRLQVGKKISNIVSELTSIKDENLDDALPYMSVVSKFKRWCGDATILTWGTSDILTLVHNCKYFSGSTKIPFLTKYANMQAYCESLLKNTGRGQLGLGTVAERLSIDTSLIEQHRALDDSLLALAVFKRLWPQNSLEPFIEDATKPEFYNKITFKTSIVSDITHPLVTNKTMLFACEKCGNRANRLSKWQFKNKRFIADFLCPCCGYKFSGRVQIKEKYEGLVVNKKSVLIPKIEKSREPQECAIGNMNLTIKENGVGLLSFNSWNKYKELAQFFSTRIGGVSKSEFDSMNLGIGRGDKDANVRKNYDLISEAMGVDRANIVAGNQTHEIKIKRVDNTHAGIGVNTPKFENSYDGLCTNEQGLTLMIYCADCVPIYYYDPIKKCIGLAHAGWRGTVAGMAGEMVKKLTEEFGSNPQDILVAIGPSIGPNNFEVDKPCADEFLDLKGSENFVKKHKEDKYLVDLWKCNIQFLVDSRVDENNITIGNVCSVSNSDLVFSHRVTRGRRGSNAGFLCMRKGETSNE